MLSSIHDSYLKASLSLSLGSPDIVVAIMNSWGELMIKPSLQFTRMIPWSLCFHYCLCHIWRISGWQIVLLLHLREHWCTSPAACPSSSDRQDYPRWNHFNREFETLLNYWIVHFTWTILEYPSPPEQCSSSNIQDLHLRAAMSFCCFSWTFLQSHVFSPTKTWPRKLFLHISGIELITT